MATEVIMPKVDMDQETGTVVDWIKKDGDNVKQGEAILVIETAKVAIEVEAPATGILQGISAEVGEELPIATVIAYILEPGEELPEGPSQEPPSATRAEESPPLPKAAPATPLAKNIAESQGLDLSRIPGSGPGGRVTKSDVESALISPETHLGQDGKTYATPAARRLAREERVELSQLVGSGPGGRIQAPDVLAAAASPHTGPAATPRPTEVKVVPLEGMRRTIAERMTRSAQTAPHFTLQIDVDMTRAEEMRASFNEKGDVKITPTAQVVKACAWALTRHPFVNAKLVGDEIHLLPEINIGVAVALEEGLIVPVVHQAEQKGIAEIAAELTDIVLRAREGALTTRDVTGGTFTVSNLGMFGIDRFTAIINPPESAILAVGRTVSRPSALNAEGDIGLVPTLTLTLSVDHRVLDGVVAARFLQDLRGAIEEPGWLSY
jgi:pyruvate dehydrogenase E2 component (dihydrolipoamide acetyltransferase)